MADTRRVYDLRSVLRVRASNRAEALRLFGQQFVSMADKNVEPVELEHGGLVKLQSLGQGVSKRTRQIRDRGLASFGVCVLLPTGEEGHEVVAYTPVDVLFDPDEMLDCLLQPHRVGETKLHSVIQVLLEELQDPRTLATAIAEAMREMMGQKADDSLARELKALDLVDNPVGD